MKICAIEVKSGSLRAVEIDENMEMKFLLRVDLEEGYDSDGLRAFQRKIEFITEGDFDKVVIKRRADKGKFCAAPVSFKIDCIIQLFSKAPVEFITAQGIAAYVKNNFPKYPPKTFKNQHEVFQTAWTAMGKHNG